MCQDHSKEKTEKKNIANIYLKLEIGCFSGSALAEKHRVEYRDYAIFKLSHKNHFSLRDKNPVLKFQKYKCPKGIREGIV